MAQPRYRWDSPYDWLMEKARDWTPEQVFYALENVAANADSDTLQDIFESEMSNDGYFRPVGENPPDEEED